MRRILIAGALALLLLPGACAGLVADKAAGVVVEAGTAAALGLTRSEVFICERKIVDALEAAAPGDVDWKKTDAAIGMCTGARAMMDTGQSAIFIAKAAQDMIEAGITKSGSGDPLAELIARRRALVNELRSRGLAVPPAAGVAPGPGAALAPLAPDPAAVKGMNTGIAPGEVVARVIMQLNGLRF